MKYLFDFEYLHPFWRYSPLKFEVVRNRAKFCMFLVSKFFGAEGRLKVWIGIIKFGLQLITVQNFMPIGRHISEISH